MNLRLVQLIGSEGNVLGILRVVLSLVQGEVLALIGGVLERTGVYRRTCPALLIGIGGHRLLCTAQLVFLLLMSIFYPLIVLHRVSQLDSHGTHAILCVDERVGGSSKTSCMNKLTLKLGIHLLHVGHFHGHALCFVEHLGSFHCAAFVPPQQSCSDTEHQEAGEDAAK